MSTKPKRTPRDKADECEAAKSDWLLLHGSELWKHGTNAHTAFCDGFYAGYAAGRRAKR